MEQRRPWTVLRNTDTSKTVTTANTWQIARRLEIQQNTNSLTIVPTSISDALDLSIHAFDYAVAFRWGDYEII